MPAPVLAVVEISGNSILLVVGVFVVTFVLVCAVAFVLLGKARKKGHRSTWTLQFGGELPVSPDTFQAIAERTAAAVKPPEISPQTRATLDSLDSLRQVFAGIYRTLMVAVGVAGIVAGVMLLRAHTPGNQYGLPGAIVLFLALGAVLSGLIPGRSIKSDEPLARDLLRQMRQKIQLQVTSNEMRAPLDETATRRLVEMLGRGVPIGDAARTVYPSYDRLSTTEKRLLESALAKYAEKARTPPG